MVVNSKTVAVLHVGEEFLARAGTGAGQDEGGRDCICECPLRPLFASDSDFKARMEACEIGLPQVLVEMVESCSMVLE